MPTNDSRLAAASTSPFLRRVRPVLQQRRDGHDEKAAGEPEQRQSNERGVHGQARRGQPHGNQGHAEGAERHEAVFDFPAGKITGRHAAEADAERKRGVQITDVFFGKVKPVGAVKKQVQEQQLRRGN